jgi:hypothetical protein
MGALWVVDADGGVASMLHPGRVGWPSWHPDGSRLAVVTGNRSIGIEKNTTLNVDSVRLGERNSVTIRVSATRGRKTVTLHARHVNRLNEPEFSLGDGSGTNKIVVRVSRAAR